MASSASAASGGSEKRVSTSAPARLVPHESGLGDRTRPIPRLRCGGLRRKRNRTFLIAEALPLEAETKMSQADSCTKYNRKNLKSIEDTGTVIA